MIERSADTVGGVVDVLVLGAGVIGLTTAVTLAEAGHEVLVRTDERPHDTTSAAAGALWGPWLVEPVARTLPWAERGLRTLTELATRTGSGVRLVSGRDVSTVEHERPSWFSLLPDARPCAVDELPAGYTHGTWYSAPLVDMPTHLAYLVERLRSAGGAIDFRPVATLDEATASARVVVNCTGLGARTLVNDQQVYPVRGQHLVVGNPGIAEFLEVDTADSNDLIAIYPHGDHIVLGGTAEPGSWNREPNLATADAILARCAAVQPLLRDAAILGHRVGLRPTRPEVRLEEESCPRGARVIHNYGHGGAGVSLAWGCAAEVLTSIT
jgi:D-amino-acid oxidase